MLRLLLAGLFTLPSTATQVVSISYSLAVLMLADRARSDHFKILECNLDQYYYPGAAQPEHSDGGG